MPGRIRTIISLALAALMAAAIISGCGKGKKDAAVSGHRWLESSYTALQGKFVRVTFTDGMTSEAFLRRATPEIITCEAWGLVFDVVPEKVKKIEEIPPPVVTTPSPQ